MPARSQSGLAQPQQHGQHGPLTMANNAACPLPPPLLPQFIDPDDLGEEEEGGGGEEDADDEDFDAEGDRAVRPGLKVKVESGPGGVGRWMPGGFLPLVGWLVCWLVRGAGGDRPPPFCLLQHKSSKKAAGGGDKASETEAENESESESESWSGARRVPPPPFSPRRAGPASRGRKAGRRRGVTGSCPNDTRQEEGEGGVHAK